MIVRQIFPRVAVRAVVFAGRAPRPLTQVRTPALPVRTLFARLFESELFSCHVCVLHGASPKDTSRRKYSSNSYDRSVPDLATRSAGPSENRMGQKWISLAVWPGRNVRRERDCSRI